MNSIYALVDPRDESVRYVGKTNNPDARYNSHCYSKSKTHCSRWVQSMKKEGWWPHMMILEDGLSEEQWPEREKHWIAHYRETGAKLTNITDGGPGVPITQPHLPFGYTLGYKVPALRKNEMCVHHPQYDVLMFFQLTDEQAGRVRQQEAIWARKTRRRKRATCTPSEVLASAVKGKAKRF